MKLLRILQVICLIGLVSCQANGLKTLITEKPLVIDSSDFKSIELKFNYEKAVTPGLSLGGLTPKIPMAEVNSFDIKDNCIWRSGGMLMTFNSLIVKLHDTLSLVDSHEKFRSIFAPIDNAQEAISYVAYLTRTYPRYDITTNLRYRVISSHFPSTYSKRVVGGFEVLLHDKIEFGCGPHPSFYKVFKITEAGHITLLETVKMFEDPEEDALCVD